MRNREQGWQYAKMSGHENESKIAEMILYNLEFREKLLNKIKIPVNDFKDVSFGGLHEESVPSILNDFTKSKTDLSIYLYNNHNNNYRVNFSIKKSTDGQVFLISKNRFIEGFSKMFNIQIPYDVIEAINLFWSNPNDNSLENIISSTNSNFSNYEYRKNRLTATTLKSYNINLYDTLLNWFKNNIYNITIFCFERGLSIDSNSYSEYVWFKNLVDSNIFLDHIYNIKYLANKSVQYKDYITYGARNGGTTITLPFGSVQWHQGQLQFRHNIKSINYIYNN